MEWSLGGGVYQSNRRAGDNNSDFAFTLHAEAHRGDLKVGAGYLRSPNQDQGAAERQTSRWYAYPDHLAVELDELLLRAVLALWQDRNPPKARFRRRVFRSLELAFSAMRAPAANLKSTMDHGVTLRRGSPRSRR